VTTIVRRDQFATDVDIRKVVPNSRALPHLRKFGSLERGIDWIGARRRDD
jgi:hypothetical protein